MGYITIQKFFIISIIILRTKLLINSKKLEGQVMINFYLISESQLPIVKVDIGEPKQSFNLILDINAEQTWIESSLYSHLLSLNYNRYSYVKELDNERYNLEGYISTDVFIIDTISIKAFGFILANTSSLLSSSLSPIKGALSLKREFEKNKMSLIDRLIDLKYAYKPIFTLIFDNIHHGSILIGNTDYDQLKDNKNRLSMCLFENIQSKSKWGCNITYVFIGDYGLIQKFDDIRNEPYYDIDYNNSKAILINKEAYFETIYNKIYVDKKFMSYLKEKYFDINGSSCVFNETDKTIQVKCLHEDVVKLNQLNFVFDSRLDLYLSYKELFYCPYAKGQCAFNIEYNGDIVKDNNTWAIGLPLLKLFETTFKQDEGIYFFGDNKEIVRLNTISSNNKGKSAVLNYLKILIYFIFGILLTLILGIGVIYALRYKNKRKKQRIEEAYNKIIE